MATEIDALQLNFTASNRVAIDSIDKLSKSLATLGDRLGVFSNAGQYETPIKNLASSIDTLSTSINGIDSEKFKGLSSSLKSFFKATSQLSNFKGFSSVESGAKGVSDEVKKMAETFAKEWGIDGKKATESLTKSIQEMYSGIEDGSMNKAYNDVKNLVKEFADLRGEIQGTNSDWQEVRKWLSSSNIKLPDMKGEWGKDFKSKRATLGVKNTTTNTSRQGDLSEQVAEMNSALGTTFDITKNEQDLLNDIVAYLEEGKRSTEELRNAYWQTNEHARMLADSTLELSDNLIKISENAKNFNENFSDVQSSPFENIVSGLTEISGVNLPDFSNIKTLSEAINKLGSGQSTNASLNLSEIAKGIQSFNGITIPQLDGITEFAQGLRSLGTKNIVAASTALQPLGEALRNFPKSFTIPEGIEQIPELAKALSAFGRKTAVEASKSLPLLTKGLKELFETLANVPHVSQNVIDLTNALSQFVNNVRYVGTGTKQASKGLNLFGNTASRVSKKSFSLAGAIGKVYATYFLLFRAFGKIREAINISSDLKEVENVVYTTFGNMTNKVEEFAQTSIKNFGMSELSAKQFAARFQAMGTAMAIPAQSVANAQKQLNRINPVLNSRGYSDTADSIADMSLNLTKLTGDIASFYNVSQEDVAKDLESIYTGMTRNLRKFGLDLTENTLKEWAMKNGLDANIKSMTQAEKTLLRYQYVMANMSAAMGDYQKTSMTWSNATRTLAQNFQRLGAVIGSGFIAWLRPMVVQVNAAMDSIIAAVQKTVNALGKIFGWQMIVDTTGSSIVDDTEAIADGYDDATAAVKKFAKQLLGIDEINNLTTNDIGKGSGDDDLYGGLSGGNIIEPGGISFERFESDIDSLFELGKKISDKLKNMMDSIDWDSVYERAKGFGKGLADFLNGLIQPGTFYRIGETIAGTLNRVVYVSLSFADTANWKKFGIALGNQINGFFNTFDFATLGESVDKWINGILEMLISAIRWADWEKVGKQIGKFLSKINFGKILKNVGKLIWEGINAAFQTYATTFKIAPLETGLLTLLGLSKTTSLITVANFKTIGDTLRNALIAFDDELLLTANRTSALNAGLKSIRSTMTPLAKGLIGVGAGFAEFFAVSDAIHDITVGTGNLAANIAELAVGVAGAGAAFTLVFGFPAGLIATGVIGLVGAFKGLYDAVNELNESRLTESLAKAFVNPNGVPLNEVIDMVSQNIVSLGDNFGIVSDKSQELETAKKNVSNIVFEISRIKDEMDAGVKSVEEGTEILNQKFDELEKAVSIKLGSAVDVLLATFGSNGVVAKAYGLTEDKTSELTKHIIENTSEQEKQIAAIREQLQNVPYGTDEWNSLYQDLVSLTTGIDTVSASMGDLSAYVEKGLDMSSYVDSKTGEIEINKIIEALNNLYGEADKVTSGFEETMEKAKQAAIDANDTQTLDLIRNGYPDALSYVNSQSAEEIKKLTDTLQAFFVDDLKNVIADAEEEWENMAWYEKLFYPDGIDQYIQKTVSNYEKDYIKPLSNEIETGLSQLGVDGAGWSYSAIQNIYAGITDFVPDVHGYRRVIKDNWMEIFNGIEYQEIGENAVNGVFEGIKNRTKSSALNDAVSAASFGIIAGFQGVLEIHSPAKAMYPIGENIVLGIFEGFNLVNFASKMSEWWRTNVQPWFSLDLWSGLGYNIKKGLTQGFNNAVAGMKGIWNDFANWLNGLLNFSWDAVKIAGKEIIPGGSINLGRIPTFANGGFPEQGSLFLAGETYGQSEWVGNIGGRTGVVSNDEITGIAQAIYQTSSEEMVMLRQQNQLLQGILEKEFGISESDIGRSARNYGIDYYNRTGNQAFTF